MDLEQPDEHIDFDVIMEIERIENSINDKKIGVKPQKLQQKIARPPSLTV